MFEAVITMADIRYPVPNGARYGPGLALSGEIVLPGCTKLQDSARGFGKNPKISLFFQNTANNRFKINAHRRVWRADLA